MNFQSSNQVIVMQKFNIVNYINTFFANANNLDALRFYRDLS